MLVNAISHLGLPYYVFCHVFIHFRISAFIQLPCWLFYLPGDGQVILSFAAGSDDQVSLVQGLHHFLSLVKTDVVEVGVGDHTFYICYGKKIPGVSVSEYV